MRYDFNVLEQRADELIAAGRPQDGIKIYLFMADGDPSLDAGYLGKRICECYERLGDLHAAKYWYGRALEEGSGQDGVTAWPDCATARRRLSTVSIDDLISPQLYVID